MSIVDPERLRILCKVRDTNFPTSAQEASLLLRVIASAETREEQEALLEVFVTTYSLTWDQGTVDCETAGIPSGNRISEHEYIMLYNGLRKSLSEFAMHIVHTNPSSTSFVSQLLDYFDALPNDQDRTVACTMILHSGLIPYAQLSVLKNDTTKELVDIDVVLRRPAVMEGRAALRRLVQLDITVREMDPAEELLALLDTFKDPVERRVILNEVIHQFYKLGFERSSNEEKSGPNTHESTDPLSAQKKKEVAKA